MSMQSPAPVPTPTHGKKNWVLGLDLGTFSVGVAALEIDDDGMPISILNAHSYIHDGGLDPSGHKSQDTRRAKSGVARRTRRRYNSLQATYRALDSFLLSNNLPVVGYIPGTDTDPWKARALLASQKLPDEIRDIALSICVRHMARHRGHRNPYLTTRSLHAPGEPSPDFLQVKEKIEAEVGEEFPADATLPEMLDRLNALNHNRRLRGNLTEKRGGKGAVLDEGIASGKRLRQSDYARELRKIQEVQGLDPELVTGLIDRVFYQKSPKGSAEKNVGFDALPGQTAKRRAPRYSATFQRYRIAAQLGNVRVRTGEGRNTNTPLRVDQFTAAFELLSTWTKTDAPTWDVVAEKLGLEPGQLRAPVTGLTGEADDITKSPFVDRTNQVLSTTKCKPISAFWKSADSARREHLLMEMSNGALSAETSSPEQEKVTAEVDELLGGMTEDEMAAFENVSLEDGRAAYSEDSLVRLTETMLAGGVDLFTARKTLFGVPDDWTPPAPPLTEHTLNAAVDRSLAHVHAALTRLESRYGSPRRIVIEYARDGMMTAKSAKKHERQATRRSNDRDAFWKARGVEGRPSPAQTRRWETVETQNSQCFYCGDKIDAASCELDHIVPRSGVGSRNTRDNLVATCVRCNRSKGNKPYATWAKTCGIPGTDRKSVVGRMEHWTEFGSPSAPAMKKLAASIKQRLRRVSLDEAVDSRSIESTAWMAREVRSRLAYRYAQEGVEVKVDAYSGRITSDARHTWVSGDSEENAVSVQRSVPMYGGVGKQRLDRRHHALDAAVVSMLSHYPAEVLAQRSALRTDNRLGISPSKSGDPTLPGGDVPPPWKEFTGVDQAHKVAFDKWKKRTAAIIELMSEALEKDRVPVTRSLRLGLSRGRVHEDDVLPFLRLPLGGAWTPEQVACIADHRVWTALTRLPDFTWGKGLGPDAARTIIVAGQTVNADDLVEVMGSVNTKGKVTYTSVGVPVRGGWSKRGEGWHHMRLYSHTSAKGKGKVSLVGERAGAADLARYRRFAGTNDLFSIPLPRHTVSVRSGIGVEESSEVYAAHMEGETRYLGWLVTGDELYIPDTVMQGKVHPNVALLQEKLGRTVNRWLVTGTTGRQLLLRPSELASEGVKGWLGEESTDTAPLKTFLEGSWAVSLSPVLSWRGVVVVRRNVLGEVRIGGGEGVPSSWVLAEGMEPK